MAENSNFDLQNFLPYLLNQAAETTSLEFQRRYREEYGMLRTEWRVLFHLGRYGDMTAKAICERARLHKTKVSRAVRALEVKNFLTRTEQPDDRRHEILTLTKRGQTTYEKLADGARRFHETLSERFSDEENAIMKRCLSKLAARPTPSSNRR